MPNGDDRDELDEAALVASGRFVTGYCDHITWWAAAVIDLPGGRLTVACPQCGPVELTAP